MRSPAWGVILGLGVNALLAFAPAPKARGQGSRYQARLDRWRAADGAFTAWALTGVSLATDGALRLDPAAAASETDPYARGAYFGGAFYNGGTFRVGEATSPEVAAAFAWTEAIPSWNASTPAGGWIETHIRVRLGARWTKWYNLGVWAADRSAIERHSVSEQGDADGFVTVDTLILTAASGVAEAYQLKVRLFQADGAASVPSLRSLTLATSTAPAQPALEPGNPALWGQRLAVPNCSQMVYPDGGEVWCSPTSIAMVLSYWQGAAGPCEPRVRAAVEGVYDWRYAGHGNWPFNTAYAATQGMEAYVARFASLAQAEPWIAAGVPVILSYAWRPGSLTGAPIPSSAGHLAVLTGFDVSGNPIVNDPAAAPDGGVGRTYRRGELEALWLKHSGGAAYLIYPPGHPASGL